MIWFIFAIVVITILILSAVQSLSTTSRLANSVKPQRIVVVGASGYIGKFVVQESKRRGYDTIAVVRPGSKRKGAWLDGVTCLESDVNDETALRRDVFDKSTDVLISCLASRSGTEDDAYRIDFQATLNSLNAAEEAGLDHFILLSAFCVQKPRLQFQFAKLKMEAALRSAHDMGRLPKYSIVRPTAYFKSLSGQFELVEKGWPFVVFGDGNICRCNPIAETDLASFMLDCITDKEKHNRVLNVGGPGAPLTMKQQGELLFELVGKEPKFISAPVGVFDAVIGGLDLAAKMFPGARDAAELVRIGRYYALEDMLTTAPGEIYGTVTLRQHFERILKEGQEYDPYTTMLAPKRT